MINMTGELKSPVAARKLARLFSQVAVYLELNNQSIFTVKSYEKVARVMADKKLDVLKLAQDGRLSSLRGVGPSIAAQIEEYLRTGTLGYLKHLKDSTPPEILEFMRLPGLGFRKAKKLSEKFNIKSVAELDKLTREGRLKGLVSLKTERQILKGLDFMAPLWNRHLYHEARAKSRDFINWLRLNMAFLRIEPTGELRRGLETIETIELVATGAPGVEPEIFTEILRSGLFINDFINSIEEHTFNPLPEKIKARVLDFGLSENYQARLWIVLPEYFLASWHFLTGNEDYWAALKQKIGPVDFFPEIASTCQTDEARLFSAWNIQNIPPQLREGQGEVERAILHQLPKLIAYEDLKGYFHAHTIASDGHMTLNELADQALEAGFSYLGLSDHSISAGHSNGLTIAEIYAQAEAVEELKTLYPELTIFWGTESDIQEDGSLDYPLAVLEKFDFIIASVHSHWNLPKDEQTARMIKAVENPFTTALGHISGRYLLSRPPYQFDPWAVIKAAAQSGCALEINTNPQRLDLDWRYLKKAKELGVKFFINPDIHNKNDLNFLTQGINAAQKGWLEAKDVYNTLNAEQMNIWLNLKKRQRNKEYDR